MKKAKVKKVKIPIAEDRDISDLFNQMLGGSTNVAITYPRYIAMRELCLKLVKVFTLLADSTLLREMNPIREEIVEYCALSKKYITVLFSQNLDSYLGMTQDYSKIPENITKAFSEDYETMKKSQFIKSLIGIADKLYPYRENFDKIDNLKHNFIYNIPGIEWSPLPFPFDIKEFMCNETITKSAIDFIMIILHKTYEFTYAIYDKIMTPDIDIDQFIDIITSSIGEIQKIPELNRCGKAFNKIKDSVLLLKNNFNEYYRDFIETKDNTTIMLNFVTDVSKNTKADPELTRQFRKIISYYQNLPKNGQNNEKVNMLFEKMNATFKEYDMDFENIGIKKTEQSESSLSNEDQEEIKK
jgi:hypothetical protein